MISNAQLWHWGRGFVLLLLLGIVPMGIGQATEVAYDNFDDNLIDPSRWTPVVWGSGGTVLETNNRLESSLMSSSSSLGSVDPGARGFGAGYTSACPLTGSFDIQVNYDLLTWPYSNGTRAKLSLLPSQLGASVPSQIFADMERTSFGVGSDFPNEPREVYLANFGDIHKITSTSDSSGALRIERSGTVITGYFLQNQTWVPLHTRANFTTQDLHFSLYLGSNDDAFASENVAGAFDNLVINSGRIRSIASTNCKLHL